MIDNSKIINDLMKPGLYFISQKYKIDVEQVYEYHKTHDINVLNVNIIKLWS